MAVKIKEKIRVLLQLLIKERSTLEALLSLKHSGYLVDVGWFNAFKNKSSVGKNNEPIPWVTYSFIDFILPRLNKNLELFEFGSGNSTLFYARYVKSILTVEHNKNWYNKIKMSLPENAGIIFKNVDEKQYEESVLLSDKFYDIIIIDAEKRVECLKQSISRLKEAGVVVLDDSDREEYADAYSIMKEKGFKHLDFWGISPGYFNRKATSVFYRVNNCLDI